MKQNYLLDTNICIFLLKNKFDVRRKIIEVGADNCYVSEITVAELYYGAAKSKQKKERLKDVNFITEKFKVLPIYPVLPIFGDIRAELEEKGKRIDDFDILIGATAIKNNVVLVSDNIKHLERLPNIRIENWIERLDRTTLTTNNQITK